MDRSFLSQASVVEASRQFVCIRTATYESAKEAEFLKTIFAGPSKNLENTVYTILSPDGETMISRPGRSMGWAYPDAAAMAKDMKRLAANYKPSGTVGALPAMGDFRVSLNVAACDNLPLIVGVADTAEGRAKLESKLKKAAWSDELVGRFGYSPSCSISDLKAAGIEAETGVYVIEPGLFGIDGRVLTRLDPDGDLSSWIPALLAALAKHEIVAKESRSHIQAGRAKGISWKTAIPVTDTQELKAGGGPPPPR